MCNGCQDLTALNSLLVRWVYLSYKKKTFREQAQTAGKHSTSLSEDGGFLSLSGCASETHPRPCKQCSACQENEACTTTTTFFYCQSQTRDITSTQGACVRPRLICTYVTHNHTTALSGCDVCQGCFISSFMWLTRSFLFLLSHICFLLNSLSCNFIGIAVYVWGGVLNQIKMLKKFNLLHIEQLYTVKCIILYTHTHTQQVQQNDSNRTGHR